MTMRMLIDARHREETRVAVVKGSRIEEFDFESAEHKQLKGNIYLAKVTRVEPSLQAAFVEYGGNRHGFLAFSEIHPDYYQIPKEDREALLREEAEHAAEEERLRGDEDDFEPPEDLGSGHHDDDGDGGGEPDESRAMASDDDGTFDDEDGVETLGGGGGIDNEVDTQTDDAGDDGGDAPTRAAATDGGTDERAVEKLREKRMNLRHRYKIQDVIRRRQVLLVQVVKEERGNKGAALTSYLSLAGRYCVLMPNTTHGGGISRKISNAGDRKRLKSIMADMNLPKTMGCIVRTAGLQRTKTEIRRDFDYLARLWDEVRENTLAAAAPALIYQDSDLIKRAIRDIYNKDIDEVVVEGEDGYKQAKSFMRLLMPSHAARVKPYADTVPLFQRNAVEDQLAAMYNPVVQLKSGGYLVINPTEALVSIDINSGRSTREYGIEATAVGTNLEAANEIARQLRLRDMAGLVVIDFIDMENSGNIRKVERAMKNALADDRARIQVGRISSFGLMEMSRQRLRTGVLEASTRSCPHCEGTGLVRTASSAGLSALRMLEDEAGRGRASQLRLTASKEAALYVLNRKRFELAAIEDRYGVVIEIASDDEEEGARMTVDVSGPPPAYRPRIEAPAPVEDDEPFEDLVDEDEEDGDEVVAITRRDGAQEDDRPQGARGREDGEGRGRGRGRRRRGKRARPDEGTATELATGDGDDLEAGEALSDDVEVEGRDASADAAGTVEGERKRRGRRGGRRRRGGRDGERTTVEAGGEAGEVEALGDDAGADDARTGDVGTAAEPVGESAEDMFDVADVAPSTDTASGDTSEPVEAELPLPAPMAAAEDGLAEAATIESDPEAVEAVVAPKPKRTRKPKVEVEVEADGAGSSSDGDKPVEPRKRTRRKAEATEAAPAEATNEPAPKPRRSRKKAEAVVDDAPAFDGASDGASDEEAEPPLALVMAPSEADARTDADTVADTGAGIGEAKDDTPTSTNAATDDTQAADDEPRRGGWWQRTFGGQS